MLLTMVHNRRRMVVVSRRRQNIKLSRSVLSVCRAPVMSSKTKSCMEAGMELEGLQV